MTTTMSSQATWADIPLEITHKIFGYCDPQSLLYLSQINHQFNFHVLTRYFTRKITDDLIQFPSKLSSKSYPWEESPPTRILRTAFCLSRTIQHINYCTPTVIDCDRYFNDLRNLTAFIHRMPKLTSLRIKPRALLKGRDVNEQSYQDIWSGLLVAAILRGCKIFEVEAYDEVHYDESHSPPRLPEGLLASGLQQKPRLFRKFGRPLAPKSTITSLHPSPPLSADDWTTMRVRPSLQEVQIIGLKFRNIPLMAQTILTQHAASITRLSLGRLTIWDAKELKRVFDHLHFPALKSFTFVDHWGESPTIFLKFLYRHPALTDLDLDADFREYQLWSPPKWSFWRQPPRFPNLQILNMFPGALICLVPDFRRCPNLRSITLKCSGCGNVIGAREPHDIVQSFFNSLHVSSITSPLSVEITVPLQDLSWISKLHTIGDDKMFPRWPRVKDLRLNDTLKFESQPCPSLDVLVNWLSSFPSLECLEIDSPVYESGEELAKSVVARCPKLRFFGLTNNYLPFRHGREWEMWDVQDGRLRSQIVHRLV